MIRQKSKKRIILLCVNGILLLASLICALGVYYMSHMLQSQQAAPRWQGDSALDYTQVSCFIPADQAVKLSEIESFRIAMMERFKEAGLDGGGQEILFADAWSCVNKVEVSSALGSGEVFATAVGGEFFTFHPLVLKSGSYLGPADLMQDLVLLDEDTAWLLFGGTDIQGMSFRINGVPFVAAGVIEREEDFASARAYTEGMGVFMSYQAYAALAGEEEPGVHCYEVIMPEPVQGFATTLARDKFPIGRGEILNNSTRFELGRLYSLITEFGSRSMHSRGLIYPYWENAARFTEDWAVLLLFMATLFAMFPVLCAAWYARRGFIRGREALEEELIPRVKEGAHEAVRVRSRRRWEKKHLKK